MECHSDQCSGYTCLPSFMVLELHGTLELLGVLIKNIVSWAPPHFGSSKSVWSLKFCTSKQFPPEGIPDTAESFLSSGSSSTTLCKGFSQTNSCQEVFNQLSLRVTCCFNPTKRR